MQIVIDISEEEYDAIKAGHSVWLTAQRGGGKTITIDLIKAVHNGTPIPKGHGRLIDADAFIDRLRDSSKRQRYNECLINEFLTVDDVFQAVIESLENKGLAEGDAPTIIEADKEVDEWDTD